MHIYSHSWWLKHTFWEQMLEIGQRPLKLRTTKHLLQTAYPKPVDGFCGPVRYLSPSHTCTNINTSQDPFQGTHVVWKSNLDPRKLPDYYFHGFDVTSKEPVNSNIDFLSAGINCGNTSQKTCIALSREWTTSAAPFFDMLADIKLYLPYSNHLPPFSSSTKFFDWRLQLSLNLENATFTLQVAAAY